MRDLLNCPNCAAPIEKDYCPYCGSVFLDWACFDVQKPTFVKIRDRITGRIKLVKLSLCSVSERMEMEPTTLWCDDQKYINIGPPDYTIEAEFTALPFKHPLTKKAVYAIEIDENIAPPEIVKDALRGFKED